MRITEQAPVAADEMAADQVSPEVTIVTEQMLGEASKHLAEFIDVPPAKKSTPVKLTSASRELLEKHPDIVTRFWELAGDPEVADPNLVAIAESLTPPDRIQDRRGNTVEVRRGYLYHNGPNYTGTEQLRSGGGRSAQPTISLVTERRFIATAPAADTVSSNIDWLRDEYEDQAAAAQIADAPMQHVARTSAPIHLAEEPGLTIEIQALR